MRCDVNISVREAGSDTLGTRTEMKNMNSLKAIAGAIAFEAQRHIDALETGGEVLIQETRRWDDSKGESFAMREKEDATDYRYFPNPEIMPIVIGDEWIDSVRASLPETAYDKHIRLTSQLGLSEHDSRIITGSKNLSDIFDKTVMRCNKPKDTANWIIVELLSIAKGDNKGEDDIKIDCGKFAKLIEIVDNKTINRNVGKKLLSLILKDNVDPEAYVSENKLGMVSDADVIEKAVREVFSENIVTVNDYRNGNHKVLGFLVGQTMKKLGGKADPQIVNSLIINELTQK